ncbi:MAG: nitronate monooxygenase, partial [Myxococcota bacterium]
IVDGRGLAAALAFGAQGAWMGTRVIASREAHAGRAYQEAIVRASGSDTAVTRCFSGKPMRVIRNAYVEGWERRPTEIRKFPEQMAISAREDVLTALRGPDSEVDATRDCMPCGQGAGAISELLSCREIIERTLREAEAVIGRLGALRA